MKLSHGVVTFVQRTLEDGLFVLEASAKLERADVSSRFLVESFKARFDDPTDLLEALISLGVAERRVARHDVLELFQNAARDLPFEVNYEIPLERKREFAEAMTDCVRMRFCMFIPSPRYSTETHVALHSLDSIESGSFEWNVSQPIQVLRPFILRLNPFETAQELVGEQGSGSVFRETGVPPLWTGVLPITVTANLPEHRTSILAIGVTIKAPPRRPYLPQALIGIAERMPPEDAATVRRLRLSPVEQPEYTYSTFVIKWGPIGIVRLDGEVKHHSSQELDLHKDEFPVDFVPIEVSKNLLQLPTVYGLCSWTERGSAVELRFVFALERPVTIFALPKGAMGATLNFEVYSLESDKTLLLDFLPVKALRRGLYSFQEFGSQTVDIECEFSGERKYFAVELQPEEDSETGANVEVLPLTRDPPRRGRTYLVSSPFVCAIVIGLIRSLTKSPLSGPISVRAANDHGG